MSQKIHNILNIKCDFPTVTLNLMLLLNYNAVVVVAFGLDDLDLDVVLTVSSGCDYSCNEC